MRWLFASRYGRPFPLACVSLLTGMQMIFFSLFMMWSFTWIPYRVKLEDRHTSIWRPLWDSINLCTQSNPYSFFSLTHQGTAGDFILEIWSEFVYFEHSLVPGVRPT